MAEALGGLGQSLGGTARGSRQHAFQVFGGEDLENAADQRGLADARPARDDQQFVPARLPDRLLLPRGQLDPQAGLDPSDGLLHIDARQRVRCGRRQPGHGLRQADFGPVQCRQVKPRLAIHLGTHDGALGDGVLHRLLDGLPLDIDQPRRVLDQLGLRVGAVTLAGQLLQRVTHGCAGPLRAVGCDAQSRCQLVGGPEADPAHVVRQLEGVGLDGGDGLLAVDAIDAGGAARTDPVLGEEDHDFAHLGLLVPALANPLQSFRADPLQVQQEIRRLLQDLECAFLVEADDAGGQFGPDAADGPGCEIALDALGGRRMGYLQLMGLELLAVFSVHHPAPARLDMLAGGDRRCVAHDGHQVTPALGIHPQHGKAVLRIVVRDPLDKTAEGLGLGIRGVRGHGADNARGRSAISGTLGLRWPCAHWAKSSPHYTVG